LPKTADQENVWIKASPDVESNQGLGSPGQRKAHPPKDTLTKQFNLAQWNPVPECSSRITIRAS
jgi:hypothetical protein